MIVAAAAQPAPAATPAATPVLNQTQNQPAGFGQTLNRPVMVQGQIEGALERLGQNVGQAVSTQDGQATVNAFTTAAARYELGEWLSMRANGRRIGRMLTDAANVFGVNNQQQCRQN